MATVKEEYELLKAKILAGKENETIHVVWHDQERKRKQENPKKSTRMSIDCRTPDAWSAMQMEKERYFAVAIDPHIAIEFMIRALREVDDAKLREWLAEGHQQEGDLLPGPPKAVIPEWLR